MIKPEEKESLTQLHINDMLRDFDDDGKEKIHDCLDDFYRDFLYSGSSEGMDRDEMAKYFNAYMYLQRIVRSAEMTMTEIPED